ncbi:DUF3219 family protein [Paenibacillus wenxiniae]|uniref:DUF3219 family protein n=1 Tax=Paenibacillus wenxiniae TaxID=1636843 RepID=A0ABW4RP93_9BACL
MSDHQATTVLINELSLTASSYELTQHLSENDTERQLLSIDFIITGGEQYHDVTSTLYQPVVEVRVPEHGIHFQASVHRYFTSIPRLEKDTDTVAVHLELIEVNA